MQQTITGPSKPTAAICINKSRLKVYNQTDPTYYMEKGQEFQIELFNPTTNTVLAKIYLNAKQISQGGLVLRPGERVFLDRYLDVAKRFKFDVYEVSNTSEVQKAIKENGDFKVEFYNESQPTYFGNPIYTYSGPTYNQPWNTNIIRSGGSTSLISTGNSTYYNNTTLNGTSSLTSSLTSSVGNYDSSISRSFASTDGFSNDTLGDISGSLDIASTSSKTLRSRSASNPASLKKLKSIETGRVEAGSTSDQKLQTVSKSFDYLPFHSTEYKLLPLSQKINTSEDLNVKRYCTKCGHKTSKTDKFCASCGNKI